MEPVKNPSDIVMEENQQEKINRKASRLSMKPESLAPDGGLHAWLIVVASFLTNGIVFGIHNCYGIIYLRLRSELEQAGVSDAALKACKFPTVFLVIWMIPIKMLLFCLSLWSFTALVGSLSIGMTFFVSPLAGILIDSIGLRRTAVLGGAIATVGMLASSFALAHVSGPFNNLNRYIFANYFQNIQINSCGQQVEAMYFTYGVLFGAGTSLAYNPSLVILGHYFHRRLGLVNGLVTAGSSVFTIVLPFFLDCILGIGLEATMQVLAGIMALLMICALTFVPIIPPVNSSSEDEEDSPQIGCSKLWKKYINFSIWKNKKYVIWAIAVPISMLGYFVPYVHLVTWTIDE